MNACAGGPNALRRYLAYTSSSPTLHYLCPRRTLQSPLQLDAHRYAMNPDSNTREQFTQNIVSKPLPTTQDGAKQEWLDLASKLRSLLHKLAHHPAMAANLNQTFLTPAASKNKVYFVCISPTELFKSACCHSLTI